MRDLVFSLQFRLIVGFAFVLAVTLGSISFYIGFATEREVERFEQEVEEARAARVRQVVTEYYGARRRWSGLQPIIERASSLYSWRIVVTDELGQVVGDSHRRSGILRIEAARDAHYFPILSDEQEVGNVLMATGDIPAAFPEPPATRLSSALNRSLLWTGVAGAAAGILLISLMSRRALVSIRALNAAAQGLGRGDLSRRVQSPGRDEIGQLSTTFNTMAEGLQNAERQRRNMTADVAHELRTPLTNVQGYIEAIRDKVLEPDSATIETIHEQVLYLSRLIEDLRLLAETEADDFLLDRRLDSMEEVVRGCVEAFRPRAEAKRVAIELEVSSDLPHVNIDRTRIAQVTNNLLENAIRHTPSGGRVSVSARADDSGISVTVADTGEGVPSEALPYVFERFYRSDPSRARATGGAGLGLTIAKQLVEAHGGRISLTSQPGKGASVTFDVPLQDEPV